MEVAFTTKNLGYKVGGSQILEAVDFVAYYGQIVGVVGENGSGKSTLLNLLAGLIKSTSGEIRLNGERPLPSISISERAKNVSYMPQAITDHPFSVLETVQMAFYHLTGRFRAIKKEHTEAARVAIERVQLEELATKSFRHLSGGEKRLTILAQKLAQRAPIILLDEPTADLDVRRRLDFIRLIREEVARGCAVVIVMHDLNTVLQQCDRVYMLKDGAVLAHGDTDAAMTPANIKSAFGVDAEIERSANGGLPRINYAPTSGA